MSKNKTHKLELGKSRTTEDKAIRSIVNKEVFEWLTKINEAEKIGFNSGGGSQTILNSKAKILAKLISETKKGKVERDVVSIIFEKVGSVVSGMAINYYNKGDY